MQTNPAKAQSLKYAFILPVYNEADVLSQSVNFLLKFLDNKWEQKREPWQIILVDNGSTDDTRQQGLACAEKNPTRIQYLNTAQKGRGQALRAAVSQVEAEIYCYIDIDLPISLDDLPAVLRPVESNQADLAVGKRAGKRPLGRRILTLALHQLNFLLFGFKLQDVQSGIKAWNRTAASLLLECKETGFFLDTELVALAQQRGLRITEVPVAWIERRYPDRLSSVKPVKDSFRAVAALCRISRKLYPSLIRNLVLFTAIGLAMVGLSISSLVFISREDLQIAFNFVATRESISNWAIGGMAAYAALWILVRNIKTAPWRLFLTLGITFYLITAGIATITPPTLSQDLYWNLAMTRGWVKDGQNPYTTTPKQLRQDEWTKPILQWRDLSMTHGPVWVLLLAGFIALGVSLTAAMVLLKIFFVLLCIAAGWMWWRVMGLHQWSAETKTKILILTALSPFVLHATIVEAHNDILIVIAILASYYFLATRRYMTSILFLLLGGFVKYVPLMLVIVPLAEALRRKDNWLARGGVLAKAAGMFAALALIFYLPFGLNLASVSGLRHELVLERLNSFQLVGTYLVSLLPFVSNSGLRAGGLVLATVLLLILIRKNKFLQAYTLPFAGVLSFATPWFMPWYGLWIYPLLGLIISLDIFAILNLALFFMQVSTPLRASLLGIAGVGIYYLCRDLHRSIVSSAKK